MNLQNVNDLITNRTAKLGDIVRQLALAGIAVIWIFKREVAGQPTIPTDLFTPGLWIIASLAFDLLQYAFASVFWVSFRVIKEKELKAKQTVENIKELVGTEFEVPDWFNLTHYAFLWLKVLSVGIAYYLLLTYLYQNVHVRIAPQ